MTFRFITRLNGLTECSRYTFKMRCHFTIHLITPKTQR